MSSRCPDPAPLLVRTTLLLALAASALAGCKREQRDFDEPNRPPIAQSSALHPGPRPAGVPDRGYAETAYAISQGKRFFTWFNCSGCHAQGGGAMGPALMNDQWRYGHAPEQIFASIAEGRPNGMPAFGGRIPDHQIWQLVAYVRSMSGLVPNDAAPGRRDGLQTGEPEQMREEQPPRPVGPSG